jgi:hypothetical protein
VAPSIKTEEGTCTVNGMNGESRDIIHSMVQFQRTVLRGGRVIQRTMHFHPGSRSVLASAANQQW